MSKNKLIFLTGCAGFIGFHLTKKLLNYGYRIIGYDNLNDYYDLNLKLKRLKILENLNQDDFKNWQFIKGDLENINSLRKIFLENDFDLVINLAAQAGVRYSIKNPQKYINTNIIGFLNILECCKEFNINKLLYASSSSVYGNNKKIPFSENDKTDKPKNIYGVTKKTNELMAETYNQLYGIESTGLRFFTIYGPWGRPDMAPMIFIKNILENKSIKIFNNGNMSREFTYIDDVIEAFHRLINLKIQDCLDNKIINIAFSKKIKLMDFINEIENKIGKKANKEFLEMQLGDIKETSADANLLKKIIGEFETVKLDNGINELVLWYKDFYNFKNN